MAFDDDICYECASGYYLSNDGKSCTAFSSTISKCENYIHNSTSSTPKCSVCETGYTVSDDGSACYKDYSQCIKMKNSTECETCSDNYYKNVTASDVCSATTCILNKPNQNVCLIAN